MRSICTSLGAWDTIEGKTPHGLTFPLAIVSATMEEAGWPAPVSWEGARRPDERARDVQLLLLSAMDSRHFWRIAPWLREVGCPVLASDRGERDPIVIVGGQAACAPAPIEHMVDVVYVGEAEASLPALLRELGRSGSRRARLERAAAVPGCLVPSCFPDGHRVHQVYAEDIGISLRRRLQVNLRPLHRMEIARGCWHKCGFCALGWRSRYREAPVEAVLAALHESADRGVRCVHLSAADAESHRQIDELREHVAELGLYDSSWSGRLDTIGDREHAAGKFYAVGIEGLSYRLRRATGKARLTDEEIVRRMATYWRSGGQTVRFHMIGGLPTERKEDADAFSALLALLADAAPDDGQTIEIARQPFGPLPHTPMQWFAPGVQTDLIRAATARHIGSDSLWLIDIPGQRYGTALVSAVAMRGGREVQPLLTDGRPKLHRQPRRAKSRWWSWLTSAGLDPLRYISEWDPDAPTPWDHIQSAYPVETLRRAHRAIRRRLGVDAI